MRNARPANTIVPTTATNPASTSSRRKFGRDTTMYANPTSASSGRNGYKPIRNGLRISGLLIRSTITPTCCNPNCIRIRNTTSAAITSASEKKQNTQAIPANTSNDTYGNPRVGCNRPNTAGKFPSRAAANGIREYPSSSENTLANAVTITSTAPSLPIPIPALPPNDGVYATRIISLSSARRASTLLLAITAGAPITASTLAFNPRYNTATIPIEINTARGIVLPGSRASPPRNVTL